MAGLQFMGIGWYIALAIVAGTLAGHYLDNWVGTSPLFLLLGLLGGVFLAFYGTYRMVITFLTGKENTSEPKGRGS